LNCGAIQLKTSSSQLPFVDSQPAQLVELTQRICRIRVGRCEQEVNTSSEIDATSLFDVKSGQLYLNRVGACPPALQSPRRSLRTGSRFARVDPTHRRVPQPGRARNRQGASQAGSCQTANDGSDKSGMGVPRSIETRNKTHACMALRWNETKKNTVLRIRMGRDQGRGRCLVALA